MDQLALGGLGSVTSTQWVGWVLHLNTVGGLDSVTSTQWVGWVLHLNTVGGLDSAGLW